MQLEDLLSNKGVKKIREEVVHTGQESAKRRTKKTKILDKRDKLKEIRYRKYLKELKKLEEEFQKKQSMEYVYRQWLKIDYVLKWVMTEEAYKYLNKKREEEPELYKRLFRCVVDPKTIENIDDYVDTIQRKGRPKRLIQLKTLVDYERKLTDKEIKIEVKEKGKPRRSI